MRTSLFVVAAFCLALCGCGGLSDDGVHLAECLKSGAQALQQHGLEVDGGV